MLDGDSKLGKTRFLAGLAGDASAYICVDCAAATEPDLRLFRRDRHSLIILDEAHAAACVRVKKLLQSSIDPVTLGQSATNTFSYRLWLHRVRIVVTSNVWSQELLELSAGDRDWLTANSYYFKVVEPLWVQRPHEEVVA